MSAQLALARLGVDCPEEVMPCRSEAHKVSSPVTAHGFNFDHFVERDGERFAGYHFIVDLWGASGLDDLDLVDQAMRSAAVIAGATLLRVDLHHFTPNGGISGVAILAESHISIHTWPERAYAAVDVFMCGDARPQEAVEALRRAFQAERIDLIEHRRGRLG